MKTPNIEFIEILFFITTAIVGAGWMVHASTPCNESSSYFTFHIKSLTVDGDEQPFSAEWLGGVSSYTGASPSIDSYDPVQHKTRLIELRHLP